MLRPKRQSGLPPELDKSTENVHRPLPLVPYRERKARRKLGGLEGQIRIAPDFDETPPEVIEAFWNSKIFPGEEE